MSCSQTSPASVWTTTMGGCGCGGGEESGCLDHNDGRVWVWRRGERLSGPQRWAGVEEERRAVVWTTTMGGWGCGCGGGEESGCLDHNDGRVWVWRRRGERLSGPQRWAGGGVGVEEERRAVVWTTTMGGCGCGGEESGCLDHNDGRVGVWVWRRRGERLSGPQRWAGVGVEEERRAVVWTTTMGGWGCGCGGGEESGCLDHNDGRVRVWRRRGERLRDECIKEVTPFGGGSVMVWAGFSAHHRTPLHHVQGNLNGKRYRDEILRPLVVPALQQIGQQAVLQDDNARPHRARVNAFLQQAGVNRMDWPACSPDLNPMENLWDHLEQRVVRNHPPAQTLQLLLALLQLEWQVIPQHQLRRLTNSMRCRCNALQIVVDIPIIDTFFLTLYENGLCLEF